MPSYVHERDPRSSLPGPGTDGLALVALIASGSIPGPSACLATTPGLADLRYQASGAGWSWSGQPAAPAGAAGSAGVVAAVSGATSPVETAGSGSATGGAANTLAGTIAGSSAGAGASPGS